MAINSYGYPDLIAPGSVLSRFATQGTGHRYSAAGFSDFRVTAATSGTRQVNIAAGWAMGKGVMVENTAAATYNLPAPAGTSQWMLVGLKRWEGASPYSSIITHVLGTTSRAVPTVTQTPGTNDTQWLALCRVTSTDALVQDVVDLRLVSTEGAGFYVCFSDLAMDQLDDAVGAEVYRADTTSGHKPAVYRRNVSVSGALAWKNMNAPDLSLEGDDVLSLTGVTGWVRQPGSRLARRGQERSLHLVMRRLSGAPDIVANANGGGFVDNLMGVLAGSDVPPAGDPITVPATMVSSGGSTYAALLNVWNSGSVYLVWLAPGTTMAPTSEIRADASWWTS